MWMPRTYRHVCPRFSLVLLHLGFRFCCDGGLPLTNFCVLLPFRLPRVCVYVVFVYSACCLFVSRGPFPLPLSFSPFSCSFPFSRAFLRRQSASCLRFNLRTTSTSPLFLFPRVKTPMVPTVSLIARFKASSFTTTSMLGWFWFLPYLHSEVSLGSRWGS